jgi:hypothetical protein
MSTFSALSAIETRVFYPSEFYFALLKEGVYQAPRFLQCNKRGIVRLIPAPYHGVKDQITKLASQTLFPKTQDS